MRRLLIAAVVPALLLADGGMVVPEIYQVSEYGQVAIISHFEGQEQLTIATGFRTLSPDVAWIIPAQALPTVDTAPSLAFTALEYYCRPLYRATGTACGCYSEVPLGGGERYGDSSGVKEISGGILGDYTYQVLQADAADTLVSYLRGHGYAVPLSAEAVLNHYLEKDWNYFVVARITDTSGFYYTTQNLGIRLTFASDSIVYPPYISRIGAAAQNVILYVLAEHRQMFRGGELKFSGPVDAGSFPGVPGLVAGPAHLTKLIKWFEPERLEDICLQQAPDDKSYRDIEYGGTYYVEPLLAMLTVFAAGFVVQSGRKRSRSRRGE